MRLAAFVMMLMLFALPGIAMAQDDGAYTLRAEWTGPCVRAKVIDVNLGNSPESFVRAVNCQISGRSLYPESEAHWVNALRDDPRVRRIDVAKALCTQVKRECIFSYSDPWTYGEQPEPETCQPRFARDIGAVVMFFFHCPDKVNCELDWANNHVRGMKTPDNSLQWHGEPGYYSAQNPGFWRAQLRGAKRAGLQFILPNLYGPDMQARGEIDTLTAALVEEDAPVKVGLFDDSWAWGVKKFGAPWAIAPDMVDTEAAAQTLYQNKWRPYFSKIPAAHWYRIDGRPVIYFYNAGTLKPANRAAAVLKRMKALFAADFGVEPFLAVDDAFFADPDMAQVADTRFRWDTLAGDFKARDGTVAVESGLSRSDMNGRHMTNAFVRWDSHGRDRIDTRFNDRLIKDDRVLRDVLARTHDADVLLIETWNDLGEGTGIGEAYDYYDHGVWRRPDHFMQLIREDNCMN